MIIKKRASVGTYAKKGTDYKNGDTITILDGGKEVEGKFGPQNVFKVKIGEGEFAMPLNRTSCENLASDYGEDTEAWAGKAAKVNMIKMLVAGSMQDVVFLTHPDKSIDDYTDDMDGEEVINV